MKVLLLNGSSRKNGCTYLALSEVAKPLQAEGIETEIVQLGAEPIRDCIGCNGCQSKSKGHCVFGDDMVNKSLWTECFMPVERIFNINQVQLLSQHGEPELLPR